MKLESLRVSAGDFEKHLTLHGLALAKGAGVERHLLQLESVANPGGPGDLVVRIQSCAGVVPAVNDRGTRELTVELWRCAETGDAMAVGYSEKWLAEGRHRRLVDAGLRFFYRSGLGDGSDLVQVLRFEWADALLKGGSQEFSFPGKGAGTPHWHYDGLEADRAVRELVVLRQLFEAGGAVPPQGEDGSVVKDFVPGGAASEAPSKRPLPGWFGGVHFPVLAQWHKVPLCTLDFGDLEPNPHASSPRDLGELENMMSSAVLYVRHQLQECSR